MHSRFALFFLLCACGGKLDTGDAGPDNDASPNPNPTSTTTSTTPTSTSSNPPPPTPKCSPMSGTSSAGKDTCSTESDWSCGTTTYDVACNCVDGSNTAQCTCSQQTQSSGSGTTIAYTGCPGCSVTGDALAALCGFPH